ncbi:Uncharacterised protein [Raoultella terrigena]|uniref:Uncharacterized protein n=1 Tax=Raoultella terrigena TaxID=577 RepID=A0A3P8IQS6_RAOTE|nr:Uncharacterised protein [Raoultella terrigena]
MLSDTPSRVAISACGSPLKPAEAKNSLRPLRQVHQLADNPLNLLLVNRALLGARIVAGKMGHLIIAECRGLPPLQLAVMIEQQIPRRTEQIGFTVLNFSLWIVFEEAGKNSPASNRRPAAASCSWLFRYANSGWA